MKVMDLALVSQNIKFKKLRKATDEFEALIIKRLLDIGLKLENPLFPKSAGSNIYNAMYKEALSEKLSGNFGFSKLLFDYLKEKMD